MLASVAAMAVAAGAATVPQATAQDATGLTGKARRGPITPVCRIGRPCYAPYRGTLVFTPLNAQQQSLSPVRTQTQQDGDYRVKLDPARYRVTTPRGTRFGGLVKPSPVTVLQSSMRHVNFVIDTGIR
jgi:hypothetical protein